MTFWAFIYMLMHHTAGCTAVTQSTHSTYATRYGVVYGGNCVQAWLISLHTPGVAWIFQ